MRIALATFFGKYLVARNGGGVHVLDTNLDDTNPAAIVAGQPTTVPPVDEAIFDLRYSEEDKGYYLLTSGATQDQVDTEFLPHRQRCYWTVEKYGEVSTSRTEATNPMKGELFILHGDLKIPVPEVYLESKLTGKFISILSTGEVNCKGEGKGVMEKFACMKVDGDE